MPIESLVRMANQIADNQRHHDDERAATDVANHIRRYWTPLMRSDLIAHADAGGSDLGRVTLMAVERLKSK